MMNNEKEKDAIDTSKLDEILPKYDPLKLNSINLAQNYVSAFNTGMNIYQCVNQLQGYIEWVVKAVNDVVKSWNVQVGESIDKSEAIARETTTEQFNTEWTNKQPELIEQVNTLTTNQFNEDWGVLENRINTTLETQNTKINSIQTQQTNLANQQTNLSNEQTTLSNRMDTFTSLSAGSTTGDAELQDIRVGANGVTYNNAGDAVRGQYSQLKEDLVNHRTYSIDVLSKLKLGYSTSGFALIHNNKRAFTPLLTRIHEDDYLNIKLLHNDYRISIYKYDENLNVIGEDTTLYSQTLSKYEYEMTPFNGYFGIYLKQVNDLPLSDYSGNSIANTVKITFNSNYDDDNLVTDLILNRCIQGSGGIVDEKTNNLYARTDFCKVNEGDVIRLTIKLSGIGLTKNIRGVAGFKDKSLNTFTGWLMCKDKLDNKYNQQDGTVELQNVDIVIPKGTNYIIVDSLIEYCGIAQIMCNKIGNIDISNKQTNLNFMLSDGTGSMALFVLPTNKTVLLDTGEAEQAVRDNFLKISRENGLITHLDYIVISHYHSDHVGNFQYLHDRMYLIDSATTVILPNELTEEQLTELKNLSLETYNHYITTNNLINEYGCKKVYPSEFENINIDSLTLEFFNTDISKYFVGGLKEYNLTSLCCYASIGNTVICFPGDAFNESFSEYTTKGRKVDILVTPHHGAGYNLINNKEILDVWLPTMLLTQLGKNVLSAITTNNNYHTWCLENRVPDYITGYNDENITINISDSKFNFKTMCRPKVN